MLSTSYPQETGGFPQEDPVYMLFLFTFLAGGIHDLAEGHLRGEPLR